ncbi:MAG: DNA repair protein RecN, partial [Acidobacteriota bacterium]
SLLQSLKSRYGGSLEAVLLRGEEIKKEMERLRDVDGAAERLDRDREEVRAAYRKGAAEISRLRSLAGARMEKRLLTELQALAFPRETVVQLEVRQSPLAGSVFEVDGVPVGYGPLGYDWIDFRISSNPGEPPRSLGLIASGGELSRILLAVRSLASRQEPLGRTLLFDEVDAGVGADVATVVGERLRALSAGHQVICVSHWAQVAAAADCHFRVEKRVDRGRTHVSVRRLTGTERGKEIARMLGGRVTPRSSLRHARELLIALSREREAG